MKIFASVLALVLVGLTGGWLWMDATAEALQDTEGIVITGAVDPATASGLINAAQDPEGGDADDSSAAGEAAADTGNDSDAAAPTTSATGRQATLDQVVTLLGASSDELIARAGDTRAAEAAKAAEQKAAEKEAAEKEAAEQRAQQEQTAQQEQQRVAPIPVQPAPVTPNGSCEWDDDHAEWDCEDDGEWDDNGGDDGDDDDR